MIRERLKGAIEAVKDGQPFKIGDLSITKDQNTVSVTGWTEILFLNILSKAKAAAELAQIKHDFQKLVSSSADWQDFVSGKTIQYKLDYDEFGKGGPGICKEINGQIEWLVDLTP